MQIQERYLCSYIVSAITGIEAGKNVEEYLSAVRVKSDSPLLQLVSNIIDRNPTNPELKDIVAGLVAGAALEYETKKEAEQKPTLVYSFEGDNVVLTAWFGTELLGAAQLSLRKDLREHFEIELKKRLGEKYNILEG